MHICNFVPQISHYASEYENGHQNVKITYFDMFYLEIWEVVQNVINLYIIYIDDRLHLCSNRRMGALHIVFIGDDYPL